MDCMINALIAGLTAGVTLYFCREEGRLSGKRLRRALRYFTVQSNLLCAVGALCLCVWPEAPWAWLLKYVGTAAVTVTMLTVFLYLWPAVGSLKPLMEGADLYMHLVTPLLALLSFCLWERRGLGLGTALLGLLPVLLYAGLYGYQILLQRPERRWEDFYGFNRGGKWYLAACAMLLGNLLICLGLWGLQQL